MGDALKTVKAMVCVCVFACVRFYKQECDVVCSSKTNGKNKKSVDVVIVVREVELDCFVAVFVLEQELQKEREREREAGLFFGFFIFCKEPDEGKREAVQHFLHIKKSEQPWLTYSTREVIRNKSALTSGK